MSSSDKQHWYVAVLVFESIVDHKGDYTPKTDVQYRLIRAMDAEAAYRRALELGAAERCSYKNPYGETCTWKFAGLEDLQEVVEGTLGDGVEVYGFIEDGPAKRRVVQRKQLTAFLGRDGAV